MSVFTFFFSDKNCLLIDFVLDARVVVRCSHLDCHLIGVNVVDITRGAR